MRARSCTDSTPLQPERRALRLATSQYGVFSREQALTAGIALRTLQYRVATRRWKEVFPGVYRVAGTPGSWHQALMAAVLAWGPGTAISHRAAAALWALPGFVVGIVELVVPRTRRREIPNTIVHRPRDLL